jgi:hypothetical protein
MLNLILPRIELSCFIASGVIIASVVYVLQRRYLNKRFSHRLPSSLILDLKDESGSSLLGTGRLQDLSLTGACFESSLLLNPNQQIKTLMHSQEKDIRVELKAQIVWIKPGASSYLYGAQFYVPPTNDPHGSVEIQNINPPAR